MKWYIYCRFSDCELWDIHIYGLRCIIQHFHIMHWCGYGFYGDEMLLHWYTQCQTNQSNETLIQISESREWMSVSPSVSFCYCFTDSDPYSFKIPLTMHDFAYGSKISHHSFMKLVRWTQTRVSLFCCSSLSLDRVVSVYQALTNIIIDR